MSSGTRGIRNRNPGNIDYNPRNDWQGQLGIETGTPKPRFAVFDSPENGIRALAKLLLNYRGKSGEPGVGGPGIDTVQETIHRWAPPGENDTGAYVESVARRLGVAATTIIDVRKPAVLSVFVESIVIHENGGNPYTPAILAEGIRRALA